MRRTMNTIPREEYNELMIEALARMRKKIFRLADEEHSKMQKADNTGDFNNAEKYDFNYNALMIIANSSFKVHTKFVHYDPEDDAKRLMIEFAKSEEKEPSEKLKAVVNQYLEDFSANTGMTREDTIARRTICINKLIILCIHACTSEELKRLDGIVKELAENI